MAEVDDIPVLLATQPKVTPRWSTRQYAVRASLSWKVYFPSFRVRVVRERGLGASALVSEGTRALETVEMERARARDD